jgi:DNA-binding LacI/PurR family transcriptional regulator
MHKGIDGLIVSYETTQKDRTPELQKHYNIPLVFINRDLSPHYPSIIPDDEEAGQNAAQNLFDNGVRYPVIIAGPNDRPASFNRVRGFKERWNGLMLRNNEEIPVYTGDFTFNSGRKGVQDLFNGRSIDGVFCCNDYMAAGAIEEIRLMGLQVPGDVKILGFDNREFSEFWPVTISTFSLPLQEMGIKSAEILLDILKENKKPEQTIKCSSLLIERASTGQ